MRNASNRRPNLVIRNLLVTKQFFSRKILSLPPRNESWKQIFNVMRLSKLTSNKSNLRKYKVNQLKYRTNVSSEESRNELKLLKCRTMMNLLGFTSSTTPENWPKPNFTKHKNSMKSAALLWQKKKSALIAFSK